MFDIKGFKNIRENQDSTYAEESSDDLPSIKLTFPKQQEQRVLSWWRRGRGAPLEALLGVMFQQVYFTDCVQWWSGFEQVLCVLIIRPLLLGSCTRAQ